MKKILVLAVGALLSGVAYGASMYDNGAFRTSDTYGHVLSGALTGSIRGAAGDAMTGVLNNGVFNSQETYGYIVSDIRDWSAPGPEGNAVELSMFEREIGNTYDNGVFHSHDTYGHVLSGSMGR